MKLLHEDVFMKLKRASYVYESAYCLKYILPIRHSFFFLVWLCRRSLHLLYLSLRWALKVVSSVVQDLAVTVLTKVPVVRPAETTAVCREVSKAGVGLGEVGAATETGLITSHVVTCPRHGKNLFAYYLSFI